jgi:hypothetical protein
LHYHPNTQPLTYELIHIQPKELHYQYKQRNEKSNNEWANKTTQNEYVELFEQCDFMFVQTYNKNAVFGSVLYPTIISFNNRKSLQKQASP